MKKETYHYSVRVFSNGFGKTIVRYKKTTELPPPHGMVPECLDRIYDETDHVEMEAFRGHVLDFLSGKGFPLSGANIVGRP